MLILRRTFLPLPYPIGTVAIRLTRGRLYPGHTHWHLPILSSYIAISAQPPFAIAPSFTDVGSQQRTPRLSFDIIVDSSRVHLG